MSSELATWLLALRLQNFPWPEHLSYSTDLDLAGARPVRNVCIKMVKERRQVLLRGLQGLMSLSANQTSHRILAFVFFVNKKLGFCFLALSQNRQTAYYSSTSREQPQALRAVVFAFLTIVFL